MRGRRRRILLGALLAEHDRSLSAERLYKLAWWDDEDDELWELEPEVAKGRLHPLISKLRSDYDLDTPLDGAAGTRLVESGGSYVLHVVSGDLDAIVFEQHLSEGDGLRAAGDLVAAMDAYRSALALWDGEPFEGMQYSFLQGIRRRLVELSLRAGSGLVEARMKLGDCAGALADLEVMLSRQPTDERLHAQKMICLHLDGRRNDALAHYYAAYKLIREETGNLPAETLLDLERRIRANDPALLDQGQGDLGARSAMSSVDSTTARPSWVHDYREVLRESLDEIDLRAFGSAAIQATSLDAVYTPILVRAGPGEVDPDGYRQDMETAVESTRAALVVGESGGGKSTFLQHLCRGHLAAEGPLPILVDLVELNSVDPIHLGVRDRLPWPALLEAATTQLRDIGIAASAGELEAMAQSGDAVWLLDGLNEIANPVLRDAVMDLIVRHATRWRQARFVVTSTAEGVGHRGTPRGFVRIDVGGLDMTTFLDRFTASRYPELSEEDRRRLWEPLVTTIRRSADLRSLARWPLYLTALALTYFTRGHVPETRMAVLQAAVNWLIRRRRSSLKAHVEQARHVEGAFQVIAHAMAAHPDGPRRRISTTWARRLLREAPGFDGSDERAAAFLDGAVSGGGLLTPRGRANFEMHDTFRDYLAARWIAARDQPDWWAEVESHLDDPRWAGLIRLLPACLYDSGSEQVDELFDRMGESSQSLPLRRRAARLALGTVALQELLPLGYELPEQSGWRDAVAGVAELFAEPHPEIPLTVRFGASVGYGLLGDPRLDDPGTQWVPFEGGTFWMGAQTEDETAANFDRDAAPWEGPVRNRTVAPFDLRRYPITVQEYARFIQSGGYRERQFWNEGLQWLEETRTAGPRDWEEQLLVPNAPVTGVSWYEATAYCAWLTADRHDGRVYRLPSEIEWEYAARRGVDAGRQFPWGDRMRAGDDAEANWAGASLRRASPVGMFPVSTTPGDGVVDLFGNVEEWCLEPWDPASDAAVTRRLYAAGAHALRGQGRAPACASRVVRGGSCIRFSRLCRPSYRSRILEDGRYHTVGFRVVAEHERSPA